MVMSSRLFFLIPLVGIFLPLQSPIAPFLAQLVTLDAPSWEINSKLRLHPFPSSCGRKNVGRRQSYGFFYGKDPCLSVSG
jgi:hypothetical protein